MNVKTAESATWDAFRGGDRTAFGQIYFAHYEGLLNYGRRFGLPAEWVEDAIQDLLVELWQYRATLSVTTSVRFYLLRSLRNQLSRHQRLPVFTAVEDEQLSFAVEFSERTNPEQGQIPFSVARSRVGDLYRSGLHKESPG